MEIEGDEDTTRLSAVIRICENCGKIDVYDGDGHVCDREYQEIRQENLEYYDWIYFIY